MPLWTTEGMLPPLRSCWVKVNGEDEPAAPTARKTIQATGPVPDSGDASATVKLTVPGTVRLDVRLQPFV